MNSLIGIWFFTALIYNGQLSPRPNENLQLYYIFNNQAQNEIYYYRTGESGFCRRTATYSADQNYIEQKITNVDPQNMTECSQDPDMQQGAVSQVEYKIENDQLYIYLPLGDDELIYVFSKN